MKRVLLLSLLLIGTTIKAQSNKPYSKEVQIKMATSYLLEEDAKNATVLGYSEKGEWIVLRQGNGNLECVADDPNKEGIEVVCYYKELSDFMQRGRDLRSEGKSFKEIFDIRGEEIEAGKLAYPKGQSMLYVMKGKEGNVDTTTGEIKDGKLRYVVYIPYATAASTGLPIKPATPGMPWLMDPGTYRAHIMITPK